MIYSTPYIQKVTSGLSYTPKSVPKGLFDTQSDRPPLQKLMIYSNSLTGKYIKIYGIGNDDTTNLPPVIPAECLKSGQEYNIAVGKIGIYNDYACTSPYTPTDAEFYVGGYGAVPDKNIYTWPEVPIFINWGEIKLHSTINGFCGSVYIGNGKTIFSPASSLSTPKTFDSLTSIVQNAGITSISDYYSCVLTQNNKIVFIPLSASNIKVYDISTQVMTTISGSATGYLGGVLCQDGRVVMIPYSTSPIKAFNPVTNAISTYSTIGGFIGAVLAPNGNVVLIPESSTQIKTFNPSTGQILSYGSGMSGYAGGVLTKDNKIVLIPNEAGAIKTFDPSNGQIQTYGSATGYFGGILAPNGKVVMIPYTATKIISFDPSNGQIDEYGDATGYGTGSLSSDGKIVMIPFDSSGQILTFQVDIPTGDFSLPSDLSTLPTSKYNMYYNKL